MTRTGQSPRLGAHMSGAVCRSASGRCAQGWARRMAVTPAFRRRMARACSRSSSAKASAVARCSCRSIGAARPPRAPRRRSRRAGRPIRLRPAGGQGDAGRHRTGRVSASGGCARPTSLAVAGGTWWARVAVAEGTEYRLATGKGPMVWHDFAYRTLGGSVRMPWKAVNIGLRHLSKGELEAICCLGPLGEPLHPRDVSSLVPPGGSARDGRMAQMRGMAHEILSIGADRLCLFRRHIRRGKTRRFRGRVDRRGRCRPGIEGRNKLRILPA